MKGQLCKYINFMQIEKMNNNQLRWLLSACKEGSEILIDIDDLEDDIIVCEGVKMKKEYREDDIIQTHVAYADPFCEREIFPGCPYSVGIITFQIQKED